MVGVIDPLETAQIQDLRRKLRLAGRLNTEVAYVKWIKRLMKSRGVTTRTHCLAADRKDVEAFLTDLLVDGKGAEPTHNQAFF